ncbi:hypothetical protein PVAND_003438 [Polypedilum vanderplanki]|uniref:tRNA (cytosine(34)-C(5))-methyltransferase n=1 Tax=Polypedilum vanderplanki TaxID=319348 RepID=A0A9J6BVT0_POLVA|nr:hypothetical protein PVAND_003438 [Polypedilum vanderplanki]
MGRNRKKNSNHFAQRRRDNKKFEPYDKKAEPYKEIVRENEDFETYYKHQKVCPEEEYENFLAALRADLPATFRLTAFKGESKRLLEIVKEKLFVDYLSGLKDLNEGKEEEMKPKNLPWYPNELAWELQISRKDIRRSEKLFKLHNFLIAETKSGNISRQEVVSMIPPLLLNVKSHHKCIDLCASPGSKTSQIIEALHSDASGKIPKGYVIANDIDNKRCYMLVHQAKRLNSPCCLITNTDAGRFPNLYNNENKIIKFDRILADVPCSGDGTMRKNPDIWFKWKGGNGLGLHGIQYRIARRGAEMLEIGGRMVYSTCSINPIENEAVICRLIREAAGSLEVVEAGSLLKGLKYNPGMTYWEPASKDLKFYKSFDDVPTELKTIIHKEIFPPPQSEIEKYNLQHCIRVLPHQNNTGAFFIAVLEKRSKLPWEKKVDENAIESKARIAAENNGNGETTSQIEPPPKKKKKLINYGFREDPFVFFTPDEELYTTFKTFYKLSDDFDPTCLLTRCLVGKKKNIYFCSPEIREILRKNEDNVKLINSGVKTFSRCDNKNMECQFRLAHEGLYNIDQFIGSERRVHVERDDLIRMLNNLNPIEPPMVHLMSESVQKQHEKIGSGSCIIHYKEDDLELRLVGWRGNKTFRAYIDVNDSIHMLRLLGADLSKYDVNKFEEKAKREQALKTDENGAEEEIPMDEEKDEELKNEN